jgi:tetratricopeptide (TPR) repeat protein
MITYILIDRRFQNRSLKATTPIPRSPKPAYKPGNQETHFPTSAQTSTLPNLANQIALQTHSPPSNKSVCPVNQIASRPARASQASLMAAAADALKEQGNKAFKEGNFIAAEEFYTQAVQRFSRNPLLFTNRANARLKLQRWEGAVNDCLKSIEISGRAQNHKAYFFLGEFSSYDFLCEFRESFLKKRELLAIELLKRGGEMTSSTASACVLMIEYSASTALITPS